MCLQLHDCHQNRKSLSISKEIPVRDVPTSAVLGAAFIAISRDWAGVGGPIRQTSGSRNAAQGMLENQCSLLASQR